MVSRKFEDLTQQEKTKVAGLVEEFAISVFKEIYNVGTVLHENHDGSMGLMDCSDIRDERVHDELFRYECKECKRACTNDDKIMLQHIIDKHL